MADETEQFSEDIRQVGRNVVGIDDKDQGTFLGTVTHCAKVAGVPVGAAGAVAMAGAGSVMIPGIGAAPGWLVGALSGFVGGTAVCTFAHRGVIHPAVHELLSSHNRSLHDLRTETQRMVKLAAPRSNGQPAGAVG